MDLNLKALIGVSYLVPIALTLRKVYAPNFEIPEAFAVVLAKMDASRPANRQLRRSLPPAAYARDVVSRDLAL